MIDRRSLLAGGAALAAAPVAAAIPAAAIPAAGIAAKGPRTFPQGFIWGAATAGHQVEGNNVNSDGWVMENVRPTHYAEPSGDACNSLVLWPRDMDLVQGLGLNAYRFSLEWARIEPEEGMFSIAMLDHYKAMIAGCRGRGLRPVVTFNHFTVPRWFAARGGWTHPQAVSNFARYCDRAARHLAAEISHATTLNEPNLMYVLGLVLPPPVFAAQQATLQAAARACGTAKFSGGNAVEPADMDIATTNLIAAHKSGREAIKAVRPDLPVGVSLAMIDDQAAGRNSLQGAMRERLYGRWLRAVTGDDFLGVQNYERMIWGPEGRIPAPKGGPVNYHGAEVYAPSLAGAVRYAHQATRLPIFVTEHGVGTNDDGIRANFIPAALAALLQTMAEGVPVLGYMHWSLLDNFEWVSGFTPRFGLYEVDRKTFARTAKPSAAVLGAIAKANAV